MKKQEQKQLRKLNLGSGNRKLPKEEGWINIDINKKHNPDIIRNLNYGLPFEDNSIDEIYASHIIEHIDDIFFFMYEIWRVCKNDTIVKVIAPYYKAVEISIHPTHKRFLRNRYFEFWNPPELFVNPVQETSTETLGAEFVTLNEEIVENNTAIKFTLGVVKVDGILKKKVTNVVNK